MPKPTDQCRVAGCTRPAKTRGVCGPCYAVHFYAPKGEKARQVEAAMLPPRPGKHAKRAAKEAPPAPGRKVKAPDVEAEIAAIRALPDFGGPQTRAEPDARAREIAGRIGAVHKSTLAGEVLAAMGIDFVCLCDGPAFVVADPHSGRAARIAEDGTVTRCRLSVVPA